jgi:hypothetical protein
MGALAPEESFSFFVRARLHSCGKNWLLGGRSLSSDIKVHALNGASAPEELPLAFFRELPPEESFSFPQSVKLRSGAARLLRGAVFIQML